MELYHQTKRLINFVTVPKYLNLTVTGTMGVLLKAKREGFIPAVRPLMENLISDGFYVSQVVQDYALKQAGEK